MRCANHPSRTPAGSCRDCHQSYCEDCLVFAFGEGRAPVCVDCALARSGRTSSRSYHGDFAAGY
ncbi:MAG: hypothetical protein U5R31_02485 [Acidimicrobiia bacterium]|nr:hypothetical protein [Acidimicrobiia bacterium]